MKYTETCKVVSQQRLAEDIFDLRIQTEHIAGEAVPGQFISLFTNRGDKLLPRPISLCGIEAETGVLRLVYRVTGPETGTEEFSRLKTGDSLRVMGPLGNGFPLAEAEGKSVFLMGGGIGIPPMLETARRLKAEKVSVLGYRSKTFLAEEFAQVSSCVIATEDGSVGTKGNVLDAVRAEGIEADVIFACGPTPMLQAIKAYALEKGIPCWVSMEERMACGIGACLGCVCRSTEVDGHSHVHNKRVCKDGPVFLSTEVAL